MHEHVMTIRGERPEDASRVRHVNEAAFGRPAEADLVERLRRACGDSLSLVAEDAAVVGHILFTPVMVESPGRRVLGMGLAPLAVLPDRQRQGVGSQLVRRGLNLLRERGCPFIVVVGHPEYYPRFGFEPARPLGIDPPFDVPDEAWMARKLPRYTDEAKGTVKYADAFDAAV